MLCRVYSVLAIVAVAAIVIRAITDFPDVLADALLLIGPTPTAAAVTIAVVICVLFTLTVGWLAFALFGRRRMVETLRAFGGGGCQHDLLVVRRETGA